MATAKNDITGDWIQSKPNSDMFEKNFDAIFRKKEPMTHDELVSKMMENPEVAKEVSRIEVIGQNGNEGIHYELDDGQLTDEQYAKIKELAEYELNKSTGDVQLKADE